MLLQVATAFRKDIYVEQDIVYLGGQWGICM